MLNINLPYGEQEWVAYQEFNRLVQKLVFFIQNDQEEYFLDSFYESWASMKLLWLGVFAEDFTQVIDRVLRT